MSFSSRPEFRDGSWPAHAVQGTPGAEWCPGLVVPETALTVSKGQDPLREAYSGFQADDIDLAALLRDQGVRRVFITGLTTDYCVRQTALDALGAGFAVLLVADAVRGVARETTARALSGLERAGVERTDSSSLMAANVGDSPR
jgi:nicotinamidase/pyrazinamidase